MFCPFYEWEYHKVRRIPSVFHFLICSVKVHYYSRYFFYSPWSLGYISPVRKSTPISPFSRDSSTVLSNFAYSYFFGPKESRFPSHKFVLSNRSRLTFTGLLLWSNWVGSLCVLRTHRPCTLSLPPSSTPSLQSVSDLVFPETSGPSLNPERDCVIFSKSDQHHPTIYT